MGTRHGNPDQPTARSAVTRGAGDAATGVPLPAAFYDRPVHDVARALLGSVISHTTPEGLVAVRLTEVEAYDGGNDPGSHAYRGRTPRTTVMFGPPGHLYVYFTYGMHHCANLVCGPDGSPSAVLLRAGEVVAGLPLARTRRPTASTDRDLARGPARLVKALGIGPEHNGADTTGSGPITVSAAATAAADITTGPRVGLAAAADWPWRYWLAGEPTVSPYKRHPVARG
jgi:DNA-3-methyladenine glycosylase